MSVPAKVRVEGNRMTRCRVVVAISTAIATMTVLGSATASSLDRKRWATRADSTCLRSKKQLFARLRTHSVPPLDLRVAALTEKQRRRLLDAFAVIRGVNAANLRRLNAITPSTFEAQEFANLRIGLRSVVSIYDDAVKSVQAIGRGSADPTTAVNVVRVGEAQAVAIELAGEYGVHECARLIEDSLLPRDPAVVRPNPADLGALLVDDPLPGFVRSNAEPAGGQGLEEEAADFAGGGDSVADARQKLIDLGFLGGYIAVFDRAGSSDYATLVVREFDTEPGAAAYLRSLREGTEDAFRSYTVAGIPRAWGFRQTNVGGDVSRFVVFRHATRMFVVGMTGVPGYSEQDVLALALAQLSTTSPGIAQLVPSTSSTGPGTTDRGRRRHLAQPEESR